MNRSRHKNTLRRRRNQARRRIVTQNTSQRKQKKAKKGAIIRTSDNQTPTNQNPQRLRPLARLKAKLPPFLSPLYAILLFPCLINFALNLYYFLCNPTDVERSFPALLFSYLFMIVLHGLFLGLFRRLSISGPILVLFAFILGFGNQFKMILSGLNPLFLDDIFFVGDAGTLGTIIAHSDLWGILVSILPETLLFLLLLTVFLLPALFFSFRFAKRRTRLASLLAAALLLLFTFLPIRPVNNLLLDCFFSEPQEYDAVAYYNKTGLLSGITGQYLAARRLTPKDYSEENAKTLLEKTAAQGSGDFGKPNIIMIFSESFFDLSRLEDVTFSEEVTPNLTRLREKGISFEMLSATFGGLSCNPEYEVLTGSNLAFYPLGYVPYTMLYRSGKSVCANFPSVIQELKNNGYTTEIVSTWNETLCNCNTVYDFMGVDRLTFDYADGIKGLYPSDEGVGRKIRSVFDTKKEGESLFFMTMTAQAHMPYYRDKYDSYDLSVLDSPLSEAEEARLLSYAQGILDADRMLGEIYDYIQTLNEPTLLVFYGDHLPILTNGSSSLYDKLAYFQTGDPLTDAARKYSTEGLILSNFDLGETSTPACLGQDLLMPYILSRCDMTLSPYFGYLASTIDILPCFNSFAVRDRQGQLKSLEELTEEEKAVYRDRLNLNAYCFALGDG